MTITLTKEELQAFSEKLESHFKRKTAAVFQVIADNPRWEDITRMRSFEDHPVLAFIEQWDKANPAPTYKDLL